MKKKKATEDITKSGVAPIEGLKYNKIDRAKFQENNKELVERIQNTGNRIGNSVRTIKNNSSGNELFSDPSFRQVVELPAAFNFGDSMFDPDLLAGLPTPESMADIRAANQGGFAKIMAGIGKGAVTALTTAAGLAGTIYGIGQGIYSLFDNDPKTGFWRSMWDNPVNLALNAINDAAEYIMPNYYSTYESLTPFVLNANFIGDKLIKNIGFMVGAFYGGMPIASVAGKTTNAIARWAHRGVQAKRAAAIAEGVKTADDIAENFRKGLETVHKVIKGSKSITSFTGSLASAMNEGAIEAVSNTNQFAKLAWAEALLAHLVRVAQIQEKYKDNPELMLQALQKEDSEMSQYRKALDEERIRMGNADYMLNLGILTFNNLNMFGKLYNRGYQHALRKFNVFGDMTSGYKAGSTWWKGALKGIKNAASEGMEEYLQRAASGGPEKMAKESLAQYIDASKDYESTYSVWDSLGSFAKEIAVLAKDPQAWEEFTIGAVSALFGMPVFGKNTRLAYLGKNKVAGLSGGIVGEIMDAVENRGKEQAIADYMNERVKDPKFRELYKNMVKHYKFETIKKEALSRGDKKKYEDAEWDQFFSDVSAWAATGKLAEFLEMLKFNGMEYSDKELESIVAITKEGKTADLQKQEATERVKKLNDRIKTIEKNIETGKKARSEAKTKRLKGSVEIASNRLRGLNKELKAAQKEKAELEKRISKNDFKDKVEGDFYVDGKPMTQTEKGKEEMREILQDNVKKLLDQVNEIVTIIRDIDVETQGFLDPDLLGALAYLKSKIYNADSRAVEAERIINSNLPKLQHALLNPITIAEEFILKLESKKKLTEHEKELLDHTKKLLEVAILNRDLFELFFLADTERKMSMLLSPEIYRKLISTARNLNSVEDSKENGYYTTMDGERIVEAMKTLAMMGIDKRNYAFTLTKYLQDPSKLLDDIDASETRASEKALNKLADDLFSKARDIKTVGLFASLVTSEELDLEVIDRLSKKIQREGSPELKEAAKLFISAHSTFEELANIVLNDESIPLETLQQIMDVLNQSIDSLLKETVDPNTGEKIGDTLEDHLKKMIKSLSKTNTGLANKLTSILNSYKNSKSLNSEPKSHKRSRSNLKEDSLKEEGKSSKSKEKKDGKNKEKTKALERNGILDIIFDHIDNLKTAEAVMDAWDKGAKLPANLLKMVDKWNKDHPKDAITLADIEELFIDWLEQEEKELDEKVDDKEVIRKSKDSDEDESVESQQESDRAAKMSAGMSTNFHSSRITKYRIYKDDKTRTYSTKRVEYEPEDALDKAVLELLNEYQAYDFMDRGYLGTLFSQDADLAIHYLKSHDDALNKGAVFLAIEWTNERASAIKKAHFNGNMGVDLSNHGVKTVTLTVEGQKKQFVIVGSLGIANNAELAVKDSYGNLCTVLNNEYEKNDEDFFISKKTNTIDQIYTGRLDKFDADEELMPLIDFVSLSTEWDKGNGKGFHIKVVVGQDIEGETGTNGLQNAIHPGLSWINSHSGAVLMYVRRPDGKFYPVRCVRKTVELWMNSKNTDLSADIRDVIEGTPLQNAYVETIIKNLINLLNPDSSFKEKVKAKMALTKFFILGKNSNININQVTGDISEIKLFDQEVKGKDLFENVMSAFLILADNNVLFTVPMKSFRPGIEDNDIISSGVLDVRLSNYYNFNSNFTIRPTDKEGNPLEKPVETKKPVEPAAQDDRMENFSTENGTYKVTYSREGGQIVSIEREDGKKITDREEEVIRFFIKASRGLAMSMAKGFESAMESRPEFLRFRKMYYDEKLGVIYDANRTGNSRLITDPNEVDKIIKERKEAIRTARQKRALEAAKRVLKEGRQQTTPSLLSIAQLDNDSLDSQMLIISTVSDNGNSGYRYIGDNNLEIPVRDSNKWWKGNDKELGQVTGTGWITVEGKDVLVIPVLGRTGEYVAVAFNNKLSQEEKQIVEGAFTTKSTPSLLQSAIKNGLSQGRTQSQQQANITSETALGDMFMVSWTSEGLQDNSDPKKHPWQKQVSDPRKVGRKVAPNSEDRAWAKDENGRDTYYMESGGRNDYTAVTFNFSVPAELRSQIEKFIAENWKTQFDFNGLEKLIKDFYSNGSKAGTKSKGKQSSESLGQMSHWCDDFDYSDETAARADPTKISEKHPIRTEILSHTNISLTSVPAKTITGSIKLLEETGKINLDDNNDLKEIIDILENNPTTKELNKAWKNYWESKQCH